MKQSLVIALLIWSIAPAIAQNSQDPLNSLPKDTIVAVIDGEAITLKDVEAYSQTKDPRKLMALNQQLFDFRDAMLSAMLGERLLKAEAKNAGLEHDIDAFLNTVLKVEAPTEAEIQEVIDRQPGANEASISLVKEYLEGVKRANARRKFVNELIAKAKKAPKPLVIHMQPPRMHVNVLPSDPSKGTGKVAIVEFSDFQCPYCKQAQPILKQVLAQYEGRVKHVWKDFPLPNHQFAMPAAVAGRCAHDQGKFWEMHDTLFNNQTDLNVPALRKHAGAIGLDMQVFNACFNSGKHRDAINAGRKEIIITGTPTVVINGRILNGMMPPDEYARIIDAELAAAN